MKEATENKTPALPPSKVYHPPVIVSLGQTLKGNGSCGGGILFEEFGCTGGSTDTVCGTGNGGVGGY